MSFSPPATGRGWPPRAPIARLARRAARGLLPILLTVLVAACGGGGSGTATGSNAGDGGAPQPGTRAVALGSSASTVSIAWAPVTGAGGYRLQRASGTGDWVTVADLPEPARSHVDGGLTAGQAYRYRLLAATGGRTLATADATTGTDAPVQTALAAAGETLLRSSVGAAGGRMASPDGQLAIEVPPGAFAAATDVVLRRITNTAPGGQGDGVEVALAAAPAQPLRLVMAAGSAPAQSDTALALQQADGSWLSLPTAARSADAVQALLPVGLGHIAGATVAGIAADQVRLAAAGGGIVVRVVRYERLYLDPASASVPTNGRVVLTPFARTLLQQVDCELEEEDNGFCVPSPVLEARAVPLLNTKAGDSRAWLVQDVVGGTPALGTVVAPPGGSGAFYLAPPRAPVPNPVVVSFRSTHQRSGRTLTLRATVQVREPYWTGNTQGMLGAAGADLSFTFGADAIWSLNAVGDGDEAAVERYGAAGTQIVSVVNIHCTASATPSTAALPPGALVVDNRTVPARYTLDLGSLWPTVISGTCPGRPGQAHVPMTVPGRLQVDGTVSADGRRIVGSATLGNVAWNWFFERRD